ncbi:four helix bundle protein [soil metagenome]
MGTFRDLGVYNKAFNLSMEIFEITKNFPNVEKYGLISQIRRSSRSVCSNVGEGYRKRRYEKHFVSKSTDADMENTETQVWLDYSLACKYIEKNIYQELIIKSEEVGRMLNHMIENPEKYRNNK